MTSNLETTSTIDHRNLPRKKRPPSLRDQALYIAYRSQGLTQEQLAQDHGLSQRRISQIIQRVESWHNSTLDLGPSTLDVALARAQSQAIYDRALHAFDHAPKQLITTKEGHRDNKPFQESTTREQPPKPQLLNTALRASKQLGRVGQASPACAGPPSADPDTSDVESETDDPTDEGIYEQIFYPLLRAREQAEIDGLVPHSRNTWILVKNCLRSFLGLEQGIDAGVYELDDATRQFLHAFLLKPGFNLILDLNRQSEPGRRVGPACAASAGPPSSSDPEPQATAFPSTLNPEPRTLNPASSPSTASNPTAPPSSQTPPPSPLPIPNQKLELQSNSSEPAASPRQLHHQQQLDAYYAALRGRQRLHFIFDPDDGPLPNHRNHPAAPVTYSISARDPPREV